MEQLFLIHKPVQQEDLAAAGAAVIAQLAVAAVAVTRVVPVGNILINARAMDKGPVGVVAALSMDLSLKPTQPLFKVETDGPLSPVFVTLL